MIRYGKAILDHTLRELCEKNKSINELKGAWNHLREEDIEETRKFLIQVHYTHGPWRLVRDMIEILDINDYINKHPSGIIPDRPAWKNISDI